MLLINVLHSALVLWLQNFVDVFEDNVEESRVVVAKLDRRQAERHVLHVITLDDALSVVLVVVCHNCFSGWVGVGSVRFG